MLLVAEYLRQQGHEILFQTADLFRSKVEARGLRFYPLPGNANYDYHRLGELIPELQQAVSPIDQANYYVKHLFGDRIPDQLRGVREVISQEHIDILLVDVAFCGILPMLLGIEPRPMIISCGVIAPIWHDPAFSILTGPNNTPEGRIENIEHSRQFNQERAPGYRHVDEVLSTLGVAIPGGYNSNSLYHLPDLFLQFAAEEFEYPLYNRPANLRFVGPILPKEENDQTPSWLAELDDSRPLIFVTQGTLANFDFSQLINPAILGLAEEDVQIVVTAGGENQDAIKKARNAIVESYIPYASVLPKTSVFVTNGGYNGVQHALSYGVPIIAAGVTEDKGAVCDRVNWSGAGIGLKTRTPTPTQIRDAVFSVLRNPGYQERAKALGVAIARTNALQTIAEIIGGASARS